jgi:hypothetical protein
MQWNFYIETGWRINCGDKKVQKSHYQHARREEKYVTSNWPCVVLTGRGDRIAGYALKARDGMTIHRDEPMSDASVPIRAWAAQPETSFSGGRRRINPRDRNEVECCTCSGLCARRVAGTFVEAIHNSPHCIIPFQSDCAVSASIRVVDALPGNDPHPSIARSQHAPGRSADYSPFRGKRRGRRFQKLNINQVSSGSIINRGFIRLARLFE